MGKTLDSGWAITEDIGICAVDACKVKIAAGSLGVRHYDFGRWWCETCGDRWGDKYGIANNKGEVMAAVANGKSTPITLLSFGYKWNEPPSVEYGLLKTLDVRKTVRNPWHVPALRKRNGLNAEVMAFMGRCKRAQTTVDQVVAWAIGGYSVAVGCGAGKDRSVAIVELAATKLVGTPYYSRLKVIHRDIDRKAAPSVEKKEDPCLQSL